MRETRLSGSVEGVMGNHDSYSDSGFDVWSLVQAARSAFSGEVTWRSSTSRTALMPAVSLRREE